MTPLGLKTTPDQGPPPLETLVSSGIYFHFLWPSAPRALTFCLLQKKIQPLPLALKPPCVRLCGVTADFAAKVHGVERPIFKSRQWQEIECMNL